MHRKKGIKKRKFNFLQKQTHAAKCCEVRPRWPAAPFWAAPLPRGVAPRLRSGNRATSAFPADLLASFRAHFNAVPMKMQKLADNLTMFDGPAEPV